MIVLVYLINILSPIITILGGLILLFGFQIIETWMWVVCGMSAVVGLIFGIATWHYGVPPRWFWIKSEIELLDNRVIVALRYAFIFFLLPLCIQMIIAW
ncbi:MAG: hypothetical protein IJU90_04950 [Bacteroidales bacterium]|nr:hypothetical protein [Bacteroidales bacterium]